ncbi:MAG TPA: hypothetical protein PLZ31_10740, partial [Myxococcota bacterium]|nr:hypothetical protein [Myxococcota bacterium]
VLIIVAVFGVLIPSSALAFRTFMWNASAVYVELYYYPHADGSPDTEFRVYSDFRVMEDYICKKIGDVRDFECGSIDVMD